MTTNSPPDGAQLIAAERDRQQTAEGCVAAHDDGHDRRELLDAAACYMDPFLARPGLWGPGACPHGWPWDGDAWKPDADPVRNLVKAGALIAAEIDRLLRLRAERGGSG